MLEDKIKEIEEYFIKIQKLGEGHTNLVVRVPENWGVSKLDDGDKYIESFRDGQFINYVGNDKVTLGELVDFVSENIKLSLDKEKKQLLFVDRIKHIKNTTSDKIKMINIEAQREIKLINDETQREIDDLTKLFEDHSYDELVIMVEGENVNEKVKLTDTTSSPTTKSETTNKGDVVERKEDIKTVVEPQKMKK